ncbi:hypothetical protein [Aggregatibacter actinomycetemcomitans]|uniref:hypothetical protein n=1 Tax=Aggregatibacter actinomycetemcomitans TaxID=714 RepID=UPI00197C7D78|nr:hypothetical protein [Aggregatibacter actinomycetemcomitans]MBN6064330.1 hypothetical protein [Aggregatibacter actinomycetemcomitans]MBN6084266.1 hypothetical protein [Aggregatibacter actinomycetemcomitans]
MFNKCKKMIFLFFVSSLAHANNFELTNSGILSSIDNEVISKSIKKTESVSYDLYFSYNKILGDVLVFESNSQYNHTCYIPIFKKQNKYFVRNSFCLDKYFNFSSEVWEINAYSIERDAELSGISNDDIINMGVGVFKPTSRSGGEINNSKISFNNLIYKTDSNELIIDYIFKLYNGDPDLRDGSLEICFRLIKDRTYLYNKPDYKEKTRMYLVKNDRVCILDKEDANQEKWYFINYKGKKEINMWIKADFVM